MLQRFRYLALAVALLAGVTTGVWAQGVQTGVLTGRVTSNDGATLPGATVSVQSPALQGVQSTVADVNGVYVLRGLPTGSYTLTFELAGMSTLKKTTDVRLGQTVSVDATLEVGGIAENVTVSADAAPVVTNATVGANFSYNTIQTLPSGRTPFLIAELAPGLTDNGPNGGQLTIGGAFAYDNVFLMDGVDINDNIFGNSNDLYIEDAVEETQVLTSGISAEYGRFSGGVINVVTKRGGDQFSGSYRQNITNPAWTDETPFETTPRVSKYNNAFEGTFGGPIVKSRLWFFGAGRYADLSDQRTFSETRLPYETKSENKRYEVKLTGTVAPNHTLSGGWVDNSSTQTQPGLGQSIDPRDIVTRELPNDLFVANYNGVLTSKLFATFQFSQKRFGFRNTGGTSTALVDSPFFTLGATGITGGRHYNAPYFDSTDPEDRNNRQLAGSLSYFLSRPGVGSHDIKGGFEWYRSTNIGGNSQSSTGYVFNADYVSADGQPVYDGQGRLIPIFVPGQTYIDNYRPTRGARINVDTNSFYVNDHITAGAHWSFDAGLRYERVRSEATGGIIGVDTDTWAPRLAATFDVKGNGRLVAQTTYGHYAGKYSEAQFSVNSPVGNPVYFAYMYDGPAGQGLDFAPGFDLANYGSPTTAEFPTANVFFDNGLHSPVTREFTASLGSQLNDRAHVKGTYVYRKVTGFVEDFTDRTTGQTEIISDGVNWGTFDNIVYRNSDIPKRNYQALLLQGQYKLRSNLMIQAHWTVQLENDGNFEGEASNQPGASSVFGDYPEVFNEARHFPVGRLDDFQRHKVRVMGIYNLGLGRAGSLDLSGVLKFNSALTYSLRTQNVPLTDIQLARLEAAGYASLPNGGVQTLFYGERGNETFKGAGLFDFGAQYSIPVWVRLRPYLKLDALNVLNNQKQIGWNTAVTPDWNGPLDELGLPLNYIKGANFGKPNAQGNYPLARPGLAGGRTFLAAFGFRF